MVCLSQGPCKGPCLDKPYDILFLWGSTGAATPILGERCRYKSLQVTRRSSGVDIGVEADSSMSEAKDHLICSKSIYLDRTGALFSSASATDNIRAARRAESHLTDTLRRVALSASAPLWSPSRINIAGFLQPEVQRLSPGPPPSLGCCTRLEESEYSYLPLAYSCTHRVPSYSTLAQASSPVRYVCSELAQFRSVDDLTSPGASAGR